jgi:hypothetical protein
MELDPLLLVALALHSNRGVYALLLGSGVSRAAGVPTGWDIVLDLTRRLAKLTTEDVGDNPEGWFAARYGEPLTYTGLMNRLAKTPAERQALLRPYFEPVGEEQAHGLKVPTAAHRAIARLVKYGYVKMILTTNFDRLVELALEGESVSPDVVATEDAFLGALPYTHSHGYVVKLHGDYRDTRLRNTSDEVANYPEVLQKFLARVFDEFGLIICGWSGQWDTALRNAILASRNRRFSTFWLNKGDPREDAKQLIAHLQATLIHITSADEFFSLLWEKLLALEEMDRPHPLSKAVAVAGVKRYVTDPVHRVHLHDLILNEAEKVRDQLSGVDFLPSEAPSQPRFQTLIKKYESAIELLASLIAALSYHDDGTNSYLLRLVLERLRSTRGPGGYQPWNDLSYYPALLVEYVGGIAALPLRRYRNLAALLIEPRYRDTMTNEEIPGIAMLHPARVFSLTGKWVPRPGADKEFTPASNYLFEVIKPFLQEYIPRNDEYEESFDIFEYLLSLTYWDLIHSSWTFVGRFGWKYNHRFFGLTPDTWGKAPPAQFIERGLVKKDEWELLKAGFLGGSAAHLESVIAAHTSWVSEVVKRWN